MDEVDAPAARSFHVAVGEVRGMENARERRQLAMALPSIAGIDARAWLWWLLKDEDADVRLTAATLLATTTDVRLLRELWQVARQDDDPRIRRLAEKLR